nr:hypothetical protein CFP56_33497 [Quercus suber]
MVKVLLTGSTGYIGGEILQQCLAHNYIDHIYILTRKELSLPLTAHRKCTQFLHDDFGSYPEHVLSKLRNAGIEVCIWALGRPRVADYKSIDDARRVGVHYTVTAAETFSKFLATGLHPDRAPKQKFPFRFIYISGYGAEQDQFRTLWMYSDSRKIRGAAEKGVFEIADDSVEIGGKRCFEAIALRPGTVMAKGEFTSVLLAESVGPAIAVDRLARCAIKTALEGMPEPGKRVLENKDCLGDDWGMVNTLTI